MILLFLHLNKQKRFSNIAPNPAGYGMNYCHHCQAKVSGALTIILVIGVLV